jgi:hypothetical protein
MKFLTLALVLSFVPLYGATYYVASSGSDQNSGRTSNEAFATIAYAKTKLASRDTLLLNRGDVFRDSLNLSSLTDPVIGAFGDAQLPKPVISGSSEITQWSLYQGAVWVASCNKKIEKLFANNRMMTLARYPDTGWLTIDTVQENNDGSNTSIKCSALSKHPRNAANYWTNAQIRWRRWSWWFETRRVNSYASTGVLSLAGQSVIHIMGDSACKGWHFYIDKKQEELDAPGEWLYDSAAQKVYFYPPSGIDPSSMLVEGAYLTSGMELAGGSVDNVCFRHFTLYGLSISKTSTVSNCRFEGIGGDGGGSALRGSWDIANSHIVNNVFENNLNTGISWYENSGRTGTSIIELDTLINTGTFPGYGGTGTWHAVGILVHLSSNVQVRYNYIDKTGYAGILLGSEGNFVQYNIIKGAMWTLNDGAAIYTDCGSSTIRNNIIYDVKGDLSSSGPWYPLGHGIWLEFLGDFRESVVENNTIVRSGCNGIFLPNNFSCSIDSNVLFDNAVAQLCLEGLDTNDYLSPPRTQKLPQNNTFRGNVCFANSRQQNVLEFQSQFDYGTMQGNYFCNPYTDSVVSGYGTGNNRYRLYKYTLSQWKALFPWADPAAKTVPLKRPAGLSEARPYGKGVIFINETPARKDFSLGSTAYKDIDGAAAAGSLSVAPYYSKILVYADSALSARQSAAFIADVAFMQRNATLKYFLSSRSSVTIIVFDQAGRTLFESKNAFQEAGPHSIALDETLATKRKAASGVYAYRFLSSSGATNATKTGKFVIAR